MLENILSPFISVCMGSCSREGFFAVGGEGPQHTSHILEAFSQALGYQPVCPRDTNLSPKAREHKLTRIWRQPCGPSPPHILAPAPPICSGHKTHTTSGSNRPQPCPSSRPPLDSSLPGLSAQKGQVLFPSIQCLSKPTQVSSGSTATRIWELGGSTLNTSD